MEKEKYITTVNYNLKESHFFIIENLHKKTTIEQNILLSEIFEMGIAMFVGVNKKDFDLNQIKDVILKNDVSNMLSKLVYESWENVGK